MRIVADTGAIYALMDKDDKWHSRAKRVLREEELELILPTTVLPEVCYLTNKYLGIKAELTFLKSILEGEIQIEELNISDYKSSIKYMEKYNDLNIGFVDATVIAVAERLSIYNLFTTDRRHFSQVKTEKEKTFKLLP